MIEKIVENFYTFLKYSIPIFLKMSPKSYTFFEKFPENLELKRKKNVNSFMGSKNFQTFWHPLNQGLNWALGGPFFPYALH